VSRSCRAIFRRHGIWQYKARVLQAIQVSRYSYHDGCLDDITAAKGPDLFKLFMYISRREAWIDSVDNMLLGIDSPLNFTREDIGLKFLNHTINRGAEMLGGRYIVYGYNGEIKLYDLEEDRPRWSRNVTSIHGGSDYEYFYEPSCDKLTVLTLSPYYAER
jgi:hypothetical protein